MKKTLMVVLCTLCAVFAAAGMGWAHPPSALALSYDKAEGMLAITAAHSVSDPKTHFIKEFDIFVDGTKVHTVTASSQKDGKEASASYAIGTLSKGTVVKVDAKCSKFGDREEEITIE